MRRLWCCLLLLCLCAGAALALDPAEAVMAQLRTLAPEARAKLVQALAAAQNPHAIRPLVTLLTEADAPFATAIKLDGIPYVDMLIRAISQYGAAAVEPLSDVLAASKSAAERKLLINALANTHTSAAVSPLLGLLKRPPGGQLTDALADQVGDALRVLGAPGMQGLTSLFTVGKDQAAARLAAMRTLAASGKQALPTLLPLAQQAAGDAGMYARQTIAAMGPIAVPLLIEMVTHPDASIRRWAMAGLRVWADPSAYAAIVSRLNDPDPEVRTQAARALGENLLLRPKVGGAVDPLTALLQDPDPAVREAAARALGEIGDPKAAPALRGMLSAPTYTDVAAASIALAKLKDPQAITLMLTTARVLDSPARYAVLQGLALVNDPRVGEVMLGALGDANPQVRTLAASALGALRTPGAIDALTRLLQGDTDGATRAAAAQALGQIADPKAVDALMVAWAAADGNYQPILGVALGLSRDPRALLMLRSAVGSSRIAALAGLAQSGDPQAVPLLLDAAKDKDARARELAMQGLGGSADPRALAALLTALKDTGEIVDGVGLAAPVRQAAASALGQSGNLQAMAPLIAALGDHAPGVVSAAAQALATLTGQSFGYDAAAWKAWLAAQPK